MFVATNQIAGTVSNQIVGGNIYIIKNAGTRTNTAVVPLWAVEPISPLGSIPTVGILGKIDITRITNIPHHYYSYYEYPPITITRITNIPNR